MLMTVGKPKYVLIWCRNEG